MSKMTTEVRRLKQWNRNQAETIAQLSQRVQELDGFGKRIARQDSWGFWRRLKWAITQK